MGINRLQKRGKSLKQPSFSRIVHRDFQRVHDGGHGRQTTTSAVEAISQRDCPGLWLCTKGRRELEGKSLAPRAKRAAITGLLRVHSRPRLAGPRARRHASHDRRCAPRLCIALLRGARRRWTGRRGALEAAPEVEPTPHAISPRRLSPAICWCATASRQSRSRPPDFLLILGALVIYFLCARPLSSTGPAVRHSLGGAALRHRPFRLEHLSIQGSAKLHAHPRDLPARFRLPGERLLHRAESPRLPARHARGAGAQCLLLEPRRFFLPAPFPITASSAASPAFCSRAAGLAIEHWLAVCSPSGCSAFFLARYFNRPNFLGVAAAIGFVLACVAATALVFIVNGDFFEQRVRHVHDAPSSPAQLWPAAAGAACARPGFRHRSGHHALFCPPISRSSQCRATPSMRTMIPRTPR